MHSVLHVTSRISPVASAFVILYVGYEATTHALLWTQFDVSHNRGDCRSATKTDLDNVPHLSDERQLLSTNIRAEFKGHCSSFVQPFWHLRGLPAGLAGLEAQASPATLVKPSIFRVEY